MVENSELKDSWSDRKLMTKAVVKISTSTEGSKELSEKITN